MQTTVPDVVLMITTKLGEYHMNEQIWLIEFDQFEAHVNEIHGPFSNLDEVFTVAARRRQEIAAIAADEFAL